MVCGPGWRGMGLGLVSCLKRGWWVCDQVFPAGSGGVCFYAVEDGAFMTKWMSRGPACAGDVGCFKEVWVYADRVGCDDIQGVPYPYGGQFEHISGRCSFEGDTCNLFNHLGGGGVALEGGDKFGRSECWCLLQVGGEIV